MAFIYTDNLEILKPQHAVISHKYIGWLKKPMEAQLVLPASKDFDTMKK